MASVEWGERYYFDNIATWMDEKKEGINIDFSLFWPEMLKEVQRSDALLLFNPADVRLEGCNVETGAARANDIPVYAIGVQESWRTLKYHPSVQIFKNAPECLRKLKEDFQ